MSSISKNGSTQTTSLSFSADLEYPKAPLVAVMHIYYMGDRASALADAVKHPTKKRTLARLVREDMTALSMPEASKDCISWTSTPTPHVTLKWVLDMHDTVKSFLKQVRKELPNGELSSDETRARDITRITWSTHVPAGVPVRESAQPLTRSTRPVPRGNVPQEQKGTSLPPNSTTMNETEHTQSVRENGAEQAPGQATPPHGGDLPAENSVSGREEQVVKDVKVSNSPFHGIELDIDAVTRREQLNEPPDERENHQLPLDSAQAKQIAALEASLAAVQSQSKVLRAQLADSELENARVKRAVRLMSQPDLDLDAASPLWSSPSSSAKSPGSVPQRTPLRTKRSASSSLDKEPSSAVLTKRPRRTTASISSAASTPGSITATPPRHVSSKAEGSHTFSSRPSSLSGSQRGLPGMPRPSITRRIDPAISAKPEWPLSTGKQNISRPDYDAVLERARMGEVAAADAQMLLEAEKSRGAVLRVQARRLRQLVSTAQQRQDTSAHSDTLFESLHTELATARDSMVKQDDALAKAKTGSDALRSQLSAMEMVCSQKDDDIAGLKQRLSNADAHHVAELYNTAAELDAARRSHKEETRHLQHALAAAQSALETANDRISTMEQAETHFEAEQSDPVRNDDAIRKVLAASTSRLAAVEAEASTLAARLQSLATTKSREVVKTEAMRSLESRLDTKSRELAQAQAALIASEEQRTEDYDSYVKVLAEGEAECQRMKAKCQKLKAKMEACVNLEDEMELLRVRLESTKSQLEESQAAYQAETTNLALSKNDLQDARDSHASLSTTLKHTQAEVTDLRLLLVVAREKAKVSQDILQDVRIQAERSGDASLQQVKDLMAQLDAAHDATAVAKCRVADLTLRISDATSALHETRRELSNVESKLAQVTLTAEAQARSLAIRDQRLDEIRRVANDATCESAAYYERTQKKLTQFTKELQEAHGHVFKVTEQLHSHERDCKGLADQLEEARRHISIIESQQSQEKETTVQHNLDITAQLQKARQSSADLVLQLDALQSEHFTTLECRQLTIVKLEEELHIKSQLSNDLEREKERARDAENQLAAVTLELHKAGARAGLAKERMAEVQRQMNAMSADGSRELAEALDQLTQEQSARNQLVAECNGHRKAVEKLEQQLQAVREAAAEASQHVIAAEQFHRRSQATAQTDLVALRHAHARQVEGLEHQLVEARANDVRAARDQLINELQTIKNEIDARQQAIEQVEHCLEVAQEATKHMTDRTAQAEQARDTLQEQAGDMLIMQRTLTQRVQELEPQLVAAKIRCGTPEAEIRSTTENFLAQVRKLEIQLATERDHVGECTQMVQSLEEELSQSGFRADDLRTRLSETDFRSEATSLELAKTANAAKRAAEIIEHTMKALRNDVDDLRRQLTCTETVRLALAERQRTVADLEKRLDEAHGRLKRSEHDKQHRLKRAADDLTHSQVEVTHLRAQIDNESAMHNKLVEDLHVQLNKSHEAMAQPRKELNAQVATASRAHQSASPVPTLPPVDPTATLRVVQLQEELATAQRLMMQLALERDNAVVEKDEVMDRQQEVLLSFERIPAIFKAARMVACSASAADACS